MTLSVLLRLAHACLPIHYAPFVTRAPIEIESASRVAINLFLKQKCLSRCYCTMGIRISNFETNKISDVSNPCSNLFLRVPLQSVAL